MAVEPTSDLPEPIQYLTPGGELVEGKTAPLSLEETRRLYEAMVRIRLIDERMVMLQRQGRIGFYIGSNGEEACIIGPIGAMRASDWLFPCYRENGGYLLRGMPLQRFIDNLFGNTNDASLGRQMPNHITWRGANIASVSSPIGTQIPHAVGAAYAARLQGRDDVAMTYFGEGGTSSNDFHTGMNFAGVWKAPSSSSAGTTSGRSRCRARSRAPPGRSPTRPPATACQASAWTGTISSPASRR